MRDFERLAELTAARLPGVAAKDARVAYWLAREGHPDPLARVVKVTGTNGKGSVVSMLSACLRRAGHTVGTFTSPHLERVTERFQCDGEEATPAALAPHVAHLCAAIPSVVARAGEALRPSFFEALLLVALGWFRERGARVLVLEGGIGGARDAVSCVPGPLTVLTTVALDHAALLGPTREAIARDKVGMANPGSALLVGPGVDRALTGPITEEATRRGLSVRWEGGEGVALGARGLAPWEARIHRENKAIRVPLRLRGWHQQRNLAAAVGALEHLATLGLASDLAGLEDVVWPARLEVFPGDPPVVLDVAHNAEGLAALGATLDALAPHGDRVVLYGASADKDVPACLPHLDALAPEVHLVQGFHRAASTAALASTWGGPVASSFDDPAEALETLRAKLAGSSRVLLATGSLFLAGALRSLLRPRDRAESC